MALNVMSLFSGVGGLEACFLEDKNFNLVGLSELDYHASSVLKYHHRKVKNFGDIKTIRPSELPDFDILTGGFPCFRGDTLVYTDNGHKEIRDIKIGDNVLTHKNRFRRVYKVGTNKAPTVTFRCQGIAPTVTTNNHPYLSIVKTTGRNSRIIDDNEIWTNVEDLTTDNFVGVPILQTSSDDKAITDTELWMLGRFVADGYTQDSKRKGRENSYNTKSIFCIGYKKVDEFEKRVSDYQHNITKSENKTVVKYIISKREPYSLFSQCGKLAHNKHFPNWVLDLPKKRLKIVLGGYLSGDGHKRKNGYWSATSVSRILVQQLGMVVAKVYGVGFTLSIASVGGEATIEGRTVNTRPSYEVCFKTTKTKQARYHVASSKVWLPVKGATPTGIIETVHNFSVEEDESYIANNAIVHNCTDISTQGKMKGIIDGNKSNLFFYMLPVIEEKKPKYIVIENVKNLLSKQMKDDYDRIIRELEKLGYNTNTQLRDASDYGTPQARVRAIIFCVRKDIEQVREGDFGNGKQQPIEAKNFKGLDSNCNYISWSKSTRAGHIDFRIREDGRINTLTTGDGCKGASTGTLVMDGDEIRNLTPNECEALNTWKKDYTKIGLDLSGTEFEIPNAKRYRMCGNGVSSSIMAEYRDFIIKNGGLNAKETIKKVDVLEEKRSGATRSRRRKSNRRLGSNGQPRD